MKQIITVLAILISGIASAQTELYAVSRCGGNTVPRYISFEGEDYVLVGDYINVVNAAALVCLEPDGNYNRRWQDYWRNYRGARLVDSHHNFHHIYISNGDNDDIEIQRRSSGRYNVRRTRTGSLSHYQLSETFDAIEAWNYALRN